MPPSNTKPWLHPHFNVAGGKITLYLELNSDTDSVGPPMDDILNSIWTGWDAILQALNSAPPFDANPLSLELVLTGKTVTAPSVVLPTGALKVLAPASGAPRISASFVPNPPPNVRPFKLTVGLGAHANPTTRGARISYVNTIAGNGYIYRDPPEAAPHDTRTHAPDFVSSISHELGHMFGLSDRYYDAVYWILGVPARTATQCSFGVDMTCKQIRNRAYVDGSGQDLRVAVADAWYPQAQLQAAQGNEVQKKAIWAAYNASRERPRFAVRTALPMAHVANDPDYDPANNLMSSGRSRLTPFQASTISAGLVEPGYRKQNWVAVLGAYRRDPAGTTDTPESASDPTQRSFPAWEADPQNNEGTGLLFHSTGNTAGSLRRYACLSAKGPGRDQDGIMTLDVRLATAKGKTATYKFGGGHFNKQIGVNIVHPNYMCYCSQLLNDLVTGGIAG